MWQSVNVMYSLWMGTKQLSAKQSGLFVSCGDIEWYSDAYVKSAFSVCIRISKGKFEKIGPVRQSMKMIRFVSF